MGCACNKGKTTQHEVVADGGTGKVLFTSTNSPTAEAVSKRYPGSIVREKGTTTPAT